MVRLSIQSLAACSLASAFVLLFACSENECKVCQKEKCTDLLEYCAQDSDCQCMAECVADKTLRGVEGCVDSCELSERPVAFAPLEECMALGCPDSDECSAQGAPPVTDDTGSGTGGSIGGGDLADCSFDPGLVHEPDGEILQLVNADMSVCVRIVRRNEGAGSLANTQWTLLEIWVGPLGEVAHISGESDICWFSSHHNFADWAHVWTGATHHGVKLREDGHGGTRTYELHSFEQGPVDPNQCAPLAEGTGRIGSVIELSPVNP